MTTGKTVQALNTLKNLLHQRLAESEWLSKEVMGRWVAWSAKFWCLSERMLLGMFASIWL